MTKFAMAALVAALTAGSGGVAYAQSVPEGQSCGGLLCDMGVFGHKTEPAPKTPSPPAAAPVAEAAPAAEPDAEPKKTVRKRKHVVRTEPKAAADKPVVAARPVAVPSKPSRDLAKSRTPSSATASLPMPAGWAAQPTPLAAPRSVPVSEAAPPAPEVAQPTPVKAAARPTPASSAAVQASPILDPFSNIPSRTPFRPLY